MIQRGSHSFHLQLQLYPAQGCGASRAYPERHWA